MAFKTSGGVVSTNLNKGEVGRGKKITGSGTET